MLSLIEDHKVQGFGGVDIIDDRIEGYVNGPMNWFDPAERCEIIPFLNQLGFDVLHFGNDFPECPMNVT